MVDLQRTKFPIAFTVERTEIQTPIISTKLWPIIYKRMQENDLHSGWYLDTFWDFVTAQASLKCGLPSTMLVNGSPVRHFNWHDLIQGPNHCIRESAQNERPPSKEDFE